MNAPTAFRGQPLLVLAVLLGGWIALRAVLWQAPFVEEAFSRTAQAAASQAGAGNAVFASLRQLPDEARPGTALRRAPVVTSKAVSLADRLPAVEPAGALRIEPQPLNLQPLEPQPLEPLPPRTAAGHSLILMAGFSRLELPPEIARYFAPRQDRALAAVPFTPTMAMAGGSAADRWSVDAWLLLREDSATAVTSGRGSYGRSQLGAVLRYRLLPQSNHRPTAYLRASQALAGAKDSEAALGLAARPFPGLPIVAAGELRLTRSGGRSMTRPAAYAVTELAPFDLPGGFAGEAYLQAGYVGGGFATGFVDGQIRAERKLFDLGSVELRAGGGAWGGAQKGASRLDVGPSATIRLEIGQAPDTTPARVSMDWRIRVAGEAEPASGPALTISAGF